MNMKKMLVLALALIMVLCLCACGENAEQPQETTTTPATTETISANGGFAERPTEDTNKTEYVIKVTDTDGNPIAGAMVQICKDSCLPGVTDANGVAKFAVAEDTGYKASFLTLPENYIYVDEAVTEWYFEDGSMEITIELKAAENGQGN